MTSSIVCTEKTLCGTLTHEDFSAFMYNFPDTKLKLQRRIHNYLDDFFFMLHKCIWNVHYFKNFDVKCVREMALKMKRWEYSSGIIVVDFWEFTKDMFFVQKGKLEISVFNPHT